MKYKTSGVCATEIDIEIENNIVKSVNFTNGCNGNLKGLSSLVVDMPVDQVIKKLEGTTCRDRGTSCPDQLAKALRQASEQINLSE